MADLSNTSEDKGTAPRIFGYKDFFPYKEFRPEQEQTIQDISEAIALFKNAILIASNGTGKTIMALSAALPIVMRDPKRKIIFCARTFTQNARVIQETKEIVHNFARKNDSFGVGAISLRGRNEMCVHKLIKRLKLPPTESMSVCTSLRKSKKCKYYNTISKKRAKKTLDKELEILAQSPLDYTDLIEYADQTEMCPYFLSKLLLKHAKIIVCNYQWIFEPNIRETFLEALECKLSDLIIIMDECHNLPEMGTDINSTRLTPYSLRQALKDLEAYRATMELIRFVTNIRNILDRVKTRVDEEVKLDADLFLKQVLSENRFSAIHQLTEVLTELQDYGEAIQTEKIDSGNPGRDFISPIVTFFESFIENYQDSAYFPCVTSTYTSNGKSIATELKCLSPRLITDPIFKESLATLSLSGTLHPFTYMNLLGLNEMGKSLKIVKMSPPFPRDHVKVVLTTRLTTQGKQRNAAMYREIIKALYPIFLNTPKNVGVFCASYEVLEGLWDNGFEMLAKKTNRKSFREEQGISAADNDVIIENYKEISQSDKYRGAVLLGVCGGRNSEGEDFPGDYMNAVVIVGIPFQKPTPSLEAKIQYYEGLFPNKGRLFGYTMPAMQRANQACGRPVRRMEDHGLIILMDYRFGQYKTYLSDWVARDMKIIPNDLSAINFEVLQFFSPNEEF